ncbi:ORFII [Banana streak GF virus]|uniref:ORFII n=1 Tax=Banana streak GF virus TaxID=328670 RepID=Q6RSW8_9VIRU|nr:ORFII [Banana streak GF virus]AAR86691.1 ORFII [Banana streak GF virus]
MNSEAYKEALRATSKGWPDNGIGFTEKESTTNLSTISRQLNTILYTVLQLRIEVASLQEELRKTKVEQSPDITKLTEQLDKVHLSSKGAAYKEDRGKIKVFKNPFDLLKEIQ